MAVCSLGFRLRVAGAFTIFCSSLVYGADRLMVTAADYHPGGIGSLFSFSLSTGKTIGAPVPIHQDAVVKAFPGNPFTYVVNRLRQDNIQIISPDLTHTVSQISVGRGTNPQDILVLNPTTAYLSRFHSKNLIKINPQAMDNETRRVEVKASIDLSRLDALNLALDPDGFPEMTFLTAVGEHILVQLQRLDEKNGFTPLNQALVAVINSTSDSVEKWIPLARTNPITDFKRGPDGSLYIGEAGFMGRDSRLDGGIERINPDTLESRGLIANEGALGGDIVDFEVIADNFLVAIVAKPGTELIIFDPTTGFRRSLISSEEYRFVNLAIDRERNRIYVSDRDSEHPRVRAFKFDAHAGDLEEEGGWELSLPPSQMALGGQS